MPRRTQLAATQRRHAVTVPDQVALSPSEFDRLFPAAAPRAATVKKKPIPKKPVKRAAKKGAR